MQSRLMTRREQLVLAFVAAAIVLGAGVVVWRNAPVKPDPPAEETPISHTVESDANAAVATTPQKVVVSIQGAVRAPGVYDFVEGDRVNDLLERAHGGTEAADLRFINLAAELVDGTTLTVPEEHDDATMVPNPDRYLLSLPVQTRDVVATDALTLPAQPASTGGTDATGKIDINRATSQELQSLPGVGPVYAEAIISYRQVRPFERIDDIQNVNGIGAKRYEAIRDLIVVRP